MIFEDAKCSTIDKGARIVLKLILEISREICVSKIYLFNFHSQ